MQPELYGPLRAQFTFHLYSLPGFPGYSSFAWFKWIPRFIVYETGIVSGEVLPVSNLVLSGDLYATTLG